MTIEIEEITRASHAFVTNKLPHPFQALFKTCENPVLCSALLLSEISLPTEFQVETFSSSQVMSRTKFKVYKYTKYFTITPK